MPIDLSLRKTVQYHLTRPKRNFSVFLRETVTKDKPLGQEKRKKLCLGQVPSLFGKCRTQNVTFLFSRTSFLTPSPLWETSQKETSSFLLQNFKRWEVRLRGGNIYSSTIAFSALNYVDVGCFCTQAKILEHH